MSPIALPDMVQLSPLEDEGEDAGGDEGIVDDDFGGSDELIGSTGKELGVSRTRSY